jgi:hypothetical protein
MAKPASKRHASSSAAAALHRWLALGRDNEQHFTDSMEVYGSSWKEGY